MAGVEQERFGLLGVRWWSPNTSLKQYGQYDLLFNCSVFVPYSQVCVGSACWVKSCDGG